MKTSGKCECTNAKDEAGEELYKRKYYYRLQLPMLYKDRKSVIYTCWMNATQCGNHAERRSDWNGECKRL